MVVGATLLVTAGAADAQAAHSTAAAPACSKQDGREDPTNSKTKVLDSYWFTVEHNGSTNTYCSLLGNVQAGDTVTAYFTLHKGAGNGTRVTLVANVASAGTKAQTLFGCATFGVADGTCTSSSSEALTVTVPQCGFQVDLIYGSALKTIMKGDYFAQHRWINGATGNLSSTASCSPGGPTPTPTSSTSAASSSSGSGVQGITTPGTGAAGSGPSPQAPIGIALLAIGASAVAYGGRRLRAAAV